MRPIVKKRSECIVGQDGDKVRVFICKKED